MEIPSDSNFSGWKKILLAAAPSATRKNVSGLFDLVCDEAFATHNRPLPTTARHGNFKYAWLNFPNFYFRFHSRFPLSTRES